MQTGIVKGYLRMFTPLAQPVVFVVYYGIWLMTGTNKQAQMDSFHKVSDKKFRT